MGSFLYQVKLGALREKLNILKISDNNNNNETLEYHTNQISSDQLLSISKLRSTLGFMYADDSRRLYDFRAVVTKQLVRTNINNNFIWQFKLLCMNPAISFQQVSMQASSIILASGTLPKIDSLEAELDCKFVNKFNGRHNMDRDCVFAAIITTGPTQNELNCSLKYSTNIQCQDDIGNIVKDVCSIVPNGILCFFTSYKRLNLFIGRWRANGTLMQLGLFSKKIFIEHQQMSSPKFDKKLQDCNKYANDTGAIMFAVFRGKASEGIDFIDKTARAVITIGIPFLNLASTEINLKRAYNDSISFKKVRLLSGDEWYTMQSFHALNQALGRCIRHSGDLGALAMIDSRLKVKKNLKHLSKWLRDVLIDVSCE